MKEPVELSFVWKCYRLQNNLKIELFHQLFTFNKACCIFPSWLTEVFNMKGKKKKHNLMIAIILLWLILLIDCGH